MKRTVTRFCAGFLFVYLLCQSVSAAKLLVPGGQIIGLHLKDDRVTVADFDPALGVETRAAGLAVGDRLLSIDGAAVTCAEDVHRALSRSDGQVEVSVERGGKTKKITLQPVATAEGPRLGVHLRIGTTGLGTVTFYDPEEDTFGALGHGVNGRDNTPVKMDGGSVFSARISGVRKGAVGTPGQLLGSITDLAPLGTLSKNTNRGVFGKAQLTSAQPLPVAESDEVRTGSATIRSTVTEQGLQEYSVEIVKIYPKGQNKTRNMLIRITDPALLEITGGIVQGMSGSPIIQDGKLVGAVTHVCVNL